MAEKAYIVSNKKTPEAVNYITLRQKALEHIERLTSNNWTDYNTHDPGITILEALCYALVDIGYRFQFDIKDILTYPKGATKTEDTLYNAQKIFTTQPITINDYRKLLIDLPGILNAWLIPLEKGNPDFYIDEENEILTYAINNRTVFLSGRYNVFLELENHEDWGDLNSPALYYTIIQGTLKGVQLELRTGFEMSLSDKTWQKGALVNILVSAGQQLEKNKFLFEVELKIKEGGTTEKYEARVLVSSKNKTLTKTQIRNALKLEGERAVFNTWLNRNKTIAKILTLAGVEFHANRNLCEDLNLIDKAGIEEIGFCFDIDADSAADLELLEAKIWFVIHEYLNPRVNFYSEEELRRQGLKTEEIFDGPKLNGGFIKNDELETSELKAKVYASDIINLIMDVEGVLNLTNFSMTKYNEWGSAIAKNQKWELSIGKGKKPQFSQSKSKLLFFKQNVPFVTRKRETIELFEGFKMANIRLRITEKNHKDIEPGNHRELNSFISVANELPRLYGVSQDGLPSTVNQTRKNAAKQLKGYLMLFDQLLTNYLAQLNGFKKWVSLDENLTSSYFSQLVKGIRDGDELYQNKIDYVADLPKWMESEKVFLERRNNILNHLLARFNESVSHHNLALYFNNRSALSILKEGVKDKITFLKSYADTSYKRAAAPNILLEQTQGGWLEKLFRQLGIEENTSISFKPGFKTKNVGGVIKHSVVWKTRDTDKTIFSANKWVKDAEEIKTINQMLFNKFAVKGADVVKAGSKWRVEIVWGAFKMRSKLLATNHTAKEFLEKWTNEIQRTSETGLMIENLLLRPINNHYNFIVDCVDVDACGADDPYSFRVTLVLPYWPENFRNMKYRRYLETTIRTQLPAHIMPKICWVNWESFIEVEEKFKRWLETRASSPWPFSMPTETNELIQALTGLNTVYPEAVLHDCEDDQDENPVILNQTKLGNF